MNHHHSPQNYNQAFAIGVGLNVAYIVVEVAFGLFSGSLALLADAGHNLSDVFGLQLAWGAAWLATVPASDRRTYGWHSASIWAAIVNGLLLLMVAGGIVWEAVFRFAHAQPVDAGTVIFVAAVGVVINGVTALLFFSGRRHDLNIKGAFLHMAADALVSLGVVLGGIGLLLTGLSWIDPVISLAVAALILFSTFSLLRDSFNLAMQAVPSEINPDEVRHFLESLPGITGVHDLHIWAISTTKNGLTAHLVKPVSDDEDELLMMIRDDLERAFGIQHTTIQIERKSGPPLCLQSHGRRTGSSPCDCV